MKKFAIMAALVLAVGSASALDLGVRGTRSHAADNNSVGLTVGQKLGEKFGVEGSFDRSTDGAANFNRYGVAATYDLTKIGAITVTPKVGLAVYDASGARTYGTAAFAGVGASYPLTKKVSLTADYAYQRGQERIRTLNGHYVSFGAKYSF